MRWLDSVCEATNVKLAQLREAMEDRRAWQCSDPWDHEESDTTKQQSQSARLLFLRVPLARGCCGDGQNQRLVRHSSAWEGGGTALIPRHATPGAAAAGVRTGVCARDNGADVAEQPGLLELQVKECRTKARQDEKGGERGGRRRPRLLKWKREGEE